MTAEAGDDAAFRLALEELYEDGGLTAKCFSGLGDDELSLLNTAVHGGHGASVYGDTDADLVAHLFEEMLGRRLSPSTDTFLDLGSGSGKLVLQMLPRVSRVEGVELSLTRHEQAAFA
jgi:hypothetical protein